ncbi:MAG TPA: ATP-binding protein, partial [Gammaproteobacteria bacterium]|nr:ATP-binding protein [Gammaproteobacteria bacterium]
MPVARSLRGRVLVWASVALTALFILTIVGLDIAYRRTLERSRAQLLEAQLLGLIALAETDAAGRLTLPQETINPQFGLANSGLFGVVWDAYGTPVWQSQSLVGIGFPPVRLPEPGMMRYETLDPEGLPVLELLVMGIDWEEEDGSYTAYTFGTAVSLDRYVQEQNNFRRNVVSWFVGVTVTMVVVILGVLGWVLRPVRRLAREVRDIEAGRRVQLTREQPTELVGLAANLNALIETERSRLTRYRNTLDDLAHSLKTPLAAMRTLLEEAGSDFAGAKELTRELGRINQRVSYQLQRARASGATGLGFEPVAVDALIADLCATLDKVYLSKQVSCELEIDPGTQFLGDSGDLSEMLGNLIENAYKYCRQRVHVTARNTPGRLTVSIDDDGPGIPAEALETLMQRGTRADESVDGQGIGLAVVSDTAALYDGTLEVSQSRLGGAQLRLQLGRAGARTTG